MTDTTETDNGAQAQAADSGALSFSHIINSVLMGLESGIFDTALAVASVWFPQLSGLSAQALSVIGNNFRLFLHDVGNGRPWGEALAGMMTADWNEVEADAKQAAIDFAEDVATALAAKGLIPQGK